MAKSFSIRGYSLRKSSCLLWKLVYCVYRNCQDDWHTKKVEFDPIAKENFDAVFQCSGKFQKFVRETLKVFLENRHTHRFENWKFTSDFTSDFKKLEPKIKVYDTSLNFCIPNTIIEKFFNFKFSWKFPRFSYYIHSCFWFTKSDHEIVNIYVD